MNRMRHGARSVVAILVVGTAGVGSTLGHGASRGMHLHLTPEPALADARVLLTVDTAEPFRSLMAGFVGDTPVRRRLPVGCRRMELLLRVPAVVRGGVVSIQAEAYTDAGRALRASAVLRVETPGPPARSGRDRRRGGSFTRSCVAPNDGRASGARRGRVRAD